MIDLIESRLDVELDHPVILPAPLSGDGDRLFCRSSRPISIGIWMKIGSSVGSIFRLTTVCAIRSDTVGIPSFLVPPFAFGISTCFTGGGKYEPDDIRFHSLYRFLDRFCSNIAIDSSSIPAEPRLAFTCWYASHKVRFAIK